jgi:hypothetical protein
MFDSVKPEATKREGYVVKFIASGWTPSNIASSKKKLRKAGSPMDIIDSSSILGYYYYYLLGIIFIKKKIRFDVGIGSRATLFSI